MIINVAGVGVVLKNPNDRVVVHSQRPGGFERDSLRAWAAMVRRASIVIDVGAYTGIYSLVAAKLGAMVHAIEPHPGVVKRLRYNILKNKASVRLIEAAASDRDGAVVKFGYNERLPLTSGGSLEQPETHVRMIDVGTVTIDALALTGISAIKIDVEKHEPAVLIGAANTIQRERPELLIETLDENMRARVADLLPAYKVAAILDGRNTHFTPR